MEIISATLFVLSFIVTIAAILGLFKPALIKQNSRLSVCGTWILLHIVIVWAYSSIAPPVEENTTSPATVIVEKEKLATKETNKVNELSNATDLNEKQPVTKEKQLRISEISKYALEPYSPKDYPKTFKIFKSRWDDINSLRVDAAKIAAKHSDCDYIELSELSTNRSKVDEIIVFVDCRNGTRIYLSEFDIKKSSITLTEAQKAWAESDAKTACRKSIEHHVVNPSTLDIHDFVGTSVSCSQ